MNTKEKQAVRIRHDDGSIVFTPEDEDRFIMEAGTTIAACQSKLAIDRFLAQFKSELLSALVGWCEKHNDQVCACYVPFSPELTVYVVTQANRYDFTLSDSLSDLEMDLFTRGWPVDVRQIPFGPKEVLNTFFDPAGSIQVYGDAL